MAESVEVELADIKRRLEELEERNAVLDLINRLRVYLDEKRFDDARSVFTEDAVGPFGDVGVDALAARSRENHGPFEGLWHIIGNVIVELDGDRATASAAVVGTHVERADAPEIHFDGGSFYDLDLVRTPAGWRISRLGLKEIWRSGPVDAAWLEKIAPARAR
jgi:hypothetical protein